MFKALAASGFFLDYPSFGGPRVYADQMRGVFAMQGLAATLPAACQAAQPAGEAWRCLLATNVAPTVASPLFLAGHVTRLHRCLLLAAWSLCCCVLRVLACCSLLLCA